MIYLDNGATTKVSAKVKKAMLPYFDLYYGNASSLHEYGQRAKEHLENARKRVASLIGVDASAIYFTSGGSESDNWAIESACKFGELKGKKHIITTTFEHHAILNTLKEKEKQGFKVTYLPVYENGIIKLEDLKKEICQDTCLVTIMFANNEIGTIQPIKEIGEICKENNIIFHSDAVQAIGQVPVNPIEMNLDMLSISAHKFHGPKGVGILYCNKKIPLFNFINGGAQEQGKRAGTENLANIVGLTVALEEALAHLQENSLKETRLRNKLFDELTKIPHSKINGDKVNRLPCNVNISFEGIEGESLILLLSEEGICASSGSACTSGSLDPSHVLLAIGLPHSRASRL